MKKTARHKIIDAALPVFAQNPLATLDQVAESAGIGRATLFRHFSGKKALMRELSLESYRRCTAVLAPLIAGCEPAAERLAAAVEALIPLGAAFHFLTYEPWHTDDVEIEAGREAYLSLWGALLRQVRDAGLTAPDLPLYWITACLDALLYAAWEGIHRGEIAPKQATILTLRAFLHGVGPNSTDEETR